MGLDMYLGVRNHVARLDYEKIREQYAAVLRAREKGEVPAELSAKLDEAYSTPADDYVELVKAFPPEMGKFADGGATITMNVAYWRKANQIHGWFVDNVQDGEDECKEHYLDREKLEELVDLCKQVQADNSRADELLPVTAGFFFGNYDRDTAYDEYYFEQIDNTVEMLEHILSVADNDMDFVYQSRW